MVTKVDEQIEVGAVFGGRRKIIPRWFIWNGRQYRIKEITYTWSERQGRASIHYFSATDGINLFELYYNSESMLWFLSQLDDGSY
ncbi:MAG: hypothetical protein JSU92_06960 [Deltaproteobacteria bacterium]|nr:MAG: hypothetical protein JSU92_06960 [Deltaproteobacteria bacterium]